MPFNGAGVFQRVRDWTNDLANGIPITDMFNDAEDNNMAAGLTNVLTKDGQTSPEANLPMATFKHTGVGAAVLRNEYAQSSQAQDNTTMWLGTVSGTNTLTGTVTPAITAYATGMEFLFIAAGANTGAVTLNVNGLGAKDLKYLTGGALTAFSVGLIKTGMVMNAVYDGTQFQTRVVNTFAAKTSYTTATAGTSFVVPDDVNYIKSKIWGGGAGSGIGTGSGDTGGEGKSGGYVEGIIAVTPTETLTVVIQDDASAQTTSTPSVGGGYSGLFRGATPLFIAGGGGGGGGATVTTDAGGAGGSGGGTTGGAGTDGEGAGAASNGQGGTQSAGGGGGSHAGGNSGTAGSSLTGGAGGAEARDNNAGGGGGAGYFGGGGGASGDATDGGGGGGGGGSSFIHADATSTTNSQGGTNPPNTSDADYVAPAGNGGAATNATTGNVGNKGMVVIRY